MSRTIFVDTPLFEEEVANILRCRVCGRSIKAHGNWGGGAKQHAEMHVRKGQAVAGPHALWGGRRSYERYYLPRVEVAT